MGRDSWFRAEIKLSICVSLLAAVFHPSCAGLKHLVAGCETPVGGMNPPEVPKTRESAASRWVWASVGWPPTDIKGNGGMISRIRALVSF